MNLLEENKMSQAVCNETTFKGLKAYELRADKYSCVVVPALGGDVMRMRDEKLDMEIFRYREDCTLDKINDSRVLWGLPTLYLPNRFDGGVLKTSDGCYKFPINEPKLGNCIHGWVHEREHEVVSVSAENGKAVIVLGYTFDESDEMFKSMPLKFRLTYTYTLSAEGLRQDIELENLSDKMLPVSLCTHTCINAPIVNGGKQEDMRLRVPAEKKCELNDRSLPTERLLDLDERDMQYKNGDMHPVLQDIDNDMYTACMNELDGKPFNGAVTTDVGTGRMIINEVSPEYRFWNMWNDKGVNGYFCPEPMTAMINCANLSLPREVTGYTEIAKGEKYTCWQSFATR